MAGTFQGGLLAALKNLKENDLREFCNTLQGWKIKEGFRNIPQSQLEKADSEQIANFIQHIYGDRYGAELTAAVLKAINQTKVAEELEAQTKHMDHFIDRHCVDIIWGVTAVEPILEDLLQHNLLTQQQYDFIQSRSSDQKKMRELYRDVRGWSYADKNLLHELLKTHDTSLIRRLENREKQRMTSPNMEHFIDRHYVDLIWRVRPVEPILEDLLQHNLLTQRKYDLIQSRSSDEEKMRKLYRVVRGWSDADKNLLYESLKTHDTSLIGDLEDLDKWWRRSPNMEHFIDRRYVDIIWRVRLVEPVLEDLLQYNLLTQQQYDLIQSRSSDQEKMRELYLAVRGWSYADKNLLHESLRTYNPSPIMHLEFKNMWQMSPFNMRHFIDKHYEDLIRAVTAVEPILEDLLQYYLLTQQQYGHIQSRSFDQEKMRELYRVVRGWSHADKNLLYESLRTHDPSLIRYLGYKDKWWMGSLDMKHFIDRHYVDLIRRVTAVEPILEDLLQHNLLTQQQYDLIQSRSSNQEKMVELYRVVRGWSDADKNLLYDSLKIHDPSLIRDLEYQDEKRMESHSSVSPGEAKMEFAMGSTSIPVSSAKKEETMAPPQMMCQLCGQDLDLGCVLTPDVVGNAYRLELKSEGLFSCQETGIKFQVTGPTIIDYHLESWNDHLTDDKYEIIGPLFSITPEKPGVVSAVYLPHYLCLKGYNESASWIKCAHFKDDNLVLETPTRIEPFYAVLENPTFSILGILLYPFTSLTDEIRSLFPYHGMVLIYWKEVPKANSTCMECKIHLYLAPSTPSIKKVVDDCEQQHRFLRIHKPPQTESLYRNKRYVINGPQDAWVNPRTLLFQPNISEVNPFVEICINKNTEDAVGDLSVVPEDGGKPVWETKLTEGDTNELIAAMSSLSLQKDTKKKHFPEKHREDLIQGVTVVAPILDRLITVELLTHEQKNTILSGTTSQDQMRILMDQTRSWGEQDKDTVYEAIKINYPALINRLEQS